MGGIISSIEPGGIAEELGWRAGDEIVSVNDHNLSDLIDYRFYTADERLVILVRRGNETAEFEVEKDFDDDLGVAFQDALFDGVHTCGAHCIFCFVEQLPKGLRKSLYSKDDDYRLSFLHGNFVTLANVTDDELQRIITQRLTPLYISVHTTHPELRDKLLGREAPSILNQIDTLAQGNISLHTQIVLCRGVNDGEYLTRTVEDLAARYPTVQSIAIVPAGLSAHRRNKTPIGSIDPDYSRGILRSVRSWQKRFLAEKGTRLIWAADEFYLNAGERIPSARTYEGFPQIENGIGLVRKFKDSAARAKQQLFPSLRSTIVREIHVPDVSSQDIHVRLRRENAQPFVASIVTGRLAAPVLREWADSLSSENLRINVFPITNRLFGEMVTVTGLIAGKDIINQLKGKDLGDILIIPSVSLRDGVFLDDVTLSDLEHALGVPVLQVAPTPYALIKLFLKELPVIS